MRYEISYFTDDEWVGTVCESEWFSGSWDELQEHLKALREVGCYNIAVSAIDETGERW